MVFRFEVDTKIPAKLRFKMKLGGCVTNKGIRLVAVVQREVKSSTFFIAFALTHGRITRMAAVIASPRNASEKIRKYKFSEPRWNLPGRKGVATAEDRFTIAFSRAYSASFQRIHHGTNQTELALAREIPVNGFGIADLLAVSWVKPQATFDSLETFLEEASFRSRAFECKLTDWRRAMSQASRYRYFAHQAIVVLPESICQRALPFIETFKKIRVGLWGFDAETNRITPYHTARPTTPKSERYYMHSIRLLDEASRRALPIR